MPEDMALQERTDLPSETWDQGHMESEPIYDIRYNSLKCQKKDNILFVPMRIILILNEAYVSSMFKISQ